MQAHSQGKQRQIQLICLTPKHLQVQQGRLLL